MYSIMIKTSLYFEISNQLLLKSSSMAKQWRYLKNALGLLSEFLSIIKTLIQFLNYPNIKFSILKENKK